MEKKFLSFREDEVQSVFRSWWKSLEDQRGDRAELRRAKTILDIVLCPAYHRLRNELITKGFNVYGKISEKLALIAGVLSHVRNNDEQDTIAEQMAKSKPGKAGAQVSGLRFRKLLAEQENVGLYRELIRAVKLLDNKANIISLAEAIYWWNDQTRRQWAFEYYAKAPSED